MSTHSISLTSSAFKHGAPIPRRHTGDGEDISPPLAWTGVPEGTRELALLCDDPDAPTPQPWVHWVLFNVLPDVTSLPEGVPRRPRLTEPIAATQGTNSWPSDNIGYRGPAPPRGHGTHHYHFVLRALDCRVTLPAGTDKQGLTKAMKGHILATGELIGTYER
jgi:Raf kinase inhibitor-like YbhB/YbcL family protein